MLLVCLGLSWMPVGAAWAESGVATPSQSDMARLVVADASETRDGSRYGIFSSIFKWFQDADAARPSEPKRAPTPTPTSAPEHDIEDPTPSHVYQAAMDLVSEIEILRRATAVVANPEEMEVRENLAPVHVYIKALEVLTKTARVQKRLGMIPVETGQIPDHDVSMQDAYGNVRTILRELRRVKRQLVIKDEIQPAVFSGGKTPALVYMKLGDASLKLDGLIGRPTTSNDVYIHMLHIHDQVEAIATELGVAIAVDPPGIDSGRESTEVAQQILRAIFKVINLQSRLGMEASGVPKLTLVQVTPADVHDAANLLLAEIIRIKVHLNVRSSHSMRRESRDKRPEDVFSQVRLVIRNLDILTRAVYQSS